MIERDLGIRTRLEIGESGRLDVIAGGEVVASRSDNIVLRMLGGGWPDEGEVVARLRARAEP